jgi:hypothetical protein
LRNGMTKTMLHQEWNMSIDAGDRGRSAGAGHLHADRKTSAAPIRPSSAKATAAFSKGD